MLREVVRAGVSGKYKDRRQRKLECGSVDLV